MRTLLALLAVAVVAGCDDPLRSAATSQATGTATPAVAPAAADSAATPPAPPAAGESGPAAAPPAGAPKGTGLSDCIATCDHGKLSRTDRATCRLNCEDAHGVQAQAPTGNEDPVGQAMTCMRACHGPGAGDVKACTGACRTKAAGLVNAPAGPVLAELETCMAGCQTERVATETDRSTCELTCEQNARVAGPAQPGNP